MGSSPLIFDVYAKFRAVCERWSYFCLDIALSICLSVFHFISTLVVNKRMYILKSLFSLWTKLRFKWHYGVIFWYDDVWKLLTLAEHCVLTGIYTNLSNGASGVNSLCDEIDLSQFCQHVWTTPLLFLFYCLLAIIVRLLVMFRESKSTCGGRLISNVLNYFT